MKNLKEKFKKIVKSDFFKQLLIYTLIFIGLSLFLISIFNKYDRWLVWGADGIRNHTINITYFRELLVKFIRTGQFSFFNWNTANGIDIFSNFAWCITGDFFSYLSILVRTKDVITLYNILAFMRIYCVGLSFLCYTRYHKINNNSSVIGALLYAFSSYVLYAAFRHPYFMNALILFPLLMLGIEKIIKEDKKIFYTIMIAITFVVNFYFAYSMALVLAIYGTILAIKTYKKEGIKKIIKVLFKTLLYSLLGIMISAFMLLPTIVSFLNSQRTSGNVPLAYSIRYYRRLMSSILQLKSTDYWIIIGTQSLILITLPLTIFHNRKENGSLLILLLVLMLPVLLAPIGSIFMGFNYPNNRWSYVISFIFAFITASFLNKEYSINKKDLLIVFVSLIIFLSLNALVENDLSRYYEIQILLLFIWLLIIYCKDNLMKLFKKINLYKLSLLIILVVGLGTSIKFIYDIEGLNYVSDFSEKEEYYNILNTAYNTIPDLSNVVTYLKDYDDDFYKISRHPYDHQDVSLIQKFNSVGYFWSITPSNYADINLDLDNSKYAFHLGNTEFDYRTKINTLLGVKYFVNYGKGIIPYGYNKLKNFDGTKIYENEYYLPFGTLYTNYITEKEYANLTPLEKEDSLLKTVVLEDNNDYNLNHAKIDYSNIVKEVNYNINDNKNILKNNNINITTSGDNYFEIEIDKVDKSELYLSIENLNYVPFNKEELINLQLNDESNKLEIAQAKRNYKWYEPNTSYKVTAKFNGISTSKSAKDIYTSPYYVNLPNTLLNLGYYDEATGKIKVTLSSIGHYTFDDIKVYAVSMDDYENDINNLRKSNFVATEWDNGYLNGTVDAESNGILQFQTMYSDGWKVYVDGKEVETLNVNKYFLGINIDKGKHEIHMEYHTPYFKEGILVSLAGIGIFVVTILYNRKKAKKN